MRTALPETSAAKSLRVNDKTNFDAAKACSLQNESWKWTFWERILLSRRIVPCRTTSSVANSLQKQRKKFNTPRKSRSQQANTRTRKKLFRINCPITNLWYKQTVSRRNFFPWKASKNSSWVKAKKTEEVNEVRYKCFLRVSEFWEKLVKPEKSQTYLVCSRINCSVVSI